MKSVIKIYPDVLFFEISGPLEFDKLEQENFSIPELLEEYKINNYLIDTRELEGSLNIIQSFILGKRAVQMIKVGVKMVNLTRESLSDYDTFVETVMHNRGRFLKVTHDLDEALKMLNVNIDDSPLKVIES